MELSIKTIKEIAEYLDCGMICYIHKITKEITPIIDTDSHDFFMTTGTEQEGLQEIEDNYQLYVKLEKMSSREGFRVMEDFTEVVFDKRIRDRLIYALERRKPFQNFKYEVDYDENIRQQWFRFKGEKYIEWVENQLKYIDEEE